MHVESSSMNCESVSNILRVLISYDVKRWCCPGWLELFLGHDWDELSAGAY